MEEPQVSAAEMHNGKINWKGKYCHAPVFVGACTSCISSSEAFSIFREAAFSSSSFV